MVMEKMLRRKNRKAILITQVADDLSHFYAQFYDDAPALDSLMTEMREQLESNPPVPGAYSAKKGDIVGRVRTSNKSN